MGQGFTDKAQHLPVFTLLRLHKGQGRDDVLVVFDGPAQLVQHIVQGVEKILRVGLKAHIAPVQGLLEFFVLGEKGVFAIGAEGVALQKKG